MGVQAKKLMDKVLWVQALWRLRASFYLLIALCRVKVPWFPTVAVSASPEAPSEPCSVSRTHSEQDVHSTLEVLWIPVAVVLFLLR